MTLHGNQSVTSVRPLLAKGRPPQFPAGSLASSSHDMVLHRTPSSLAPDTGPRPAAGPPRSGRALTCLLTPLHSERALSLALLQHLSQELPDLAFTLEDRAGIDVLWVCGYDRGNAD